MKGQWIGHYIGNTSGTIILNVDERPTCFQGVAYLNEHDLSLPTTAALFKTTDKSRSLKFRTSLMLPINPQSALPDLWDKVKSHYANDVTFSKYADVNVSWDEAHILSAIDLPICEREKVVHELRYMGITAGSMFPGLDGACEQLKEQNFEI